MLLLLSSEEDFLILGGGKYFCLCSSLFPVKADSWKFLRTFGLGFLAGVGEETKEETLPSTLSESPSDLSDLELGDFPSALLFFSEGSLESDVDLFNVLFCFGLENIFSEFSDN